VQQNLNNTEEEKLVINKKLETILERLDENRTTLAKIEEKTTRIEKKSSEMEESVKSLNVQIKEIKYGFNELKEGMTLFVIDMVSSLVSKTVKKETIAKELIASIKKHNIAFANPIKIEEYINNKLKENLITTTTNTDRNEYNSHFHINRQRLTTKKNNTNGN
jgi:predicted nuclease with TOPRIM domain